MQANEIGTAAPATTPATVKTVAAQVATGVKALMTTAGNLLMTWHERHSQRRHLGALDDRLLKDMGLSRADIEEEVTKPFWRL